jgi:NAD(P)-dependent dehydrogenase (short-subunit alcohol dehydrogenase family)
MVPARLIPAAPFLPGLALGALCFCAALTPSLVPRGGLLQGALAGLGFAAGYGVAVAGGILNAPTEAGVDAVNIKVGGMLRLVRAVDPWLGKSSRLVAIGGHYGFEPTAYAAAAGIANAALANLMRQLSLVYGERGITAHLIAPGPADTDRLRRVAADRATQRGTSVEQVMAEMVTESSIHAMTTPAQVAWAVALLLDPEADAMTGSALMLDSGRRRGLP